MKSHTDLIYRDIDSSPALNLIIQKKLDKLYRYSDAIIRSRVVLDSPHKHKHKGKLFRASIEIAIKGKPITVSSDDTSVHVAVRDAFIAAERRLKNNLEKRNETRH